ncbi:DUF2635 domain-containing protein [Vibrio splendidus]|uniref:DUF2635 domain-containing protein n=1 Tax=Vibrio splendidus TaxID=29497 RepID=UPI00352E5F22
MKKHTVTTFTIKPAKTGLLVKDPVTRKPLAAKGEEKPRNAYWLRRLADKSIVDMKKESKQ